jgi:hypothetical protein
MILLWLLSLACRVSKLFVKVKDKNKGNGTTPSKPKHLPAANTLRMELGFLLAASGRPTVAKARSARPLVHCGTKDRHP